MKQLRFLPVLMVSLIVTGVMAMSLNSRRNSMLSSKYERFMVVEAMADTLDVDSIDVVVEAIDGEYEDLDSVAIAEDLARFARFVEVYDDSDTIAVEEPVDYTQFSIEETDSLQRSVLLRIIMNDEDDELYRDELFDTPYLTNPKDALSILQARMLIKYEFYDEALELLNKLQDKNYPYVNFLRYRINEYKRLMAIAESDPDSLSASDLYDYATLLDPLENGKEVTEYLEKSFNMGYLPAANELALYYYNHNGGFLNNENRENLMEWLRKGCDAGDADALFTMSVLYGEGMVFPYNYKKNKKYLLEAAEKGSKTAMNNLSFLYGYKSAEKDYDKFMSCRIKAADAGHIGCMKSLIGHYVNAGDYQKALEYARKATEKGDSEAYLNLFNSVFSRDSGEKIPVEFLNEVYSELLNQCGVSYTIESYIGNIGYLIDLCNLSEEEWKDLEKKAADGDEEAIVDLILDARYGLRDKINYEKELKLLEEQANVDPAYEFELGVRLVNLNGNERNFDKGIGIINKVLDESAEIVGLYENAIQLAGDDEELLDMLYEEIPDMPVLLNLNYNDANEYEMDFGNIAETKEFYSQLNEYYQNRDEIQRLAAKNDADALFKLGELENFNLIPGDYEYYNVLTNIQKAARLGSKDAMKALSRNFEERGIGVASDFWNLKAEGVDPLKVKEK